MGLTDPVLGDARLRVVLALDLHVPPGVVGTDDLQDQIGAAPVVRFGVAGRSRHARAADRAHGTCRPECAGAAEHNAPCPPSAPMKGKQGEEQMLRDGLVAVRWHGQDLQMAVGEFEQQLGVVRQLEILRLCPEPLERIEVDDRVGVRSDDPQFKWLRRNRHGHLHSVAGCMAMHAYRTSEAAPRADETCSSHPSSFETVAHRPGRGLVPVVREPASRIRPECKESAQLEMSGRVPCGHHLAFQPARNASASIPTQNASASIAITESAPALRVASSEAVLGSSRRTKNRAVASFAR